MIISPSDINQNNPEYKIEAWAKANGREPYFWQWRDSLDLVPQEDSVFSYGPILKACINSSLNHFEP